ncbi:hypothetical protein R1sor_001699 [Riccia sorocarpa]|uniref:F-box domain-containing protein n=1 Tax=Riccia sorocarpa TaxID=122646 RepID=A0ABD3GZU0_9MARC
MEVRSKFMAFSKGARVRYTQRDQNGARKGWVWKRCGSSFLPVVLKKTEPDPVPNWGKLLDDVLVQIFERLPLQERSQVVPLVCRNWNKVSCDPTSWRRIDMLPWIQHQIDTECKWEYDMQPYVDYLVKKLVDRSRGQLRELHTMYISDEAVDYLAERCPLLEVLTMPSSLGVTDKSALKLARVARRLQHLDVSDCYNISKEAISAFGDNCPALEWLSRSMINQNVVNEAESSSSPPGGDEEAIVMSEHYPKLKRLEMKKTKISDRGLRRLVIGCPNLQQLDFSCCYQLTRGALDDVSKNCSNLAITKPITPRMHVTPTHPHCTMLFE